MQIDCVLSSSTTISFEANLTKIRGHLLAKFLRTAQEPGPGSSEGKIPEMENRGLVMELVGALCCADLQHPEILSELVLEQWRFFATAHAHEGDALSVPNQCFIFLKHWF